MRYIWSDGGRFKSRHRGEGDDCTVRAVSVAFRIPYNFAHDLCTITGRKPNDGFAFIWMPDIVPNINGYGWRYLPQFIGTPFYLFLDKRKKGRYIVSLYGHVVAVINGQYYDLDEISKHRKIKNVWQVVKLPKRRTK